MANDPETPADTLARIDDTLLRIADALETQAASALALAAGPPRGPDGQIIPPSPDQLAIGFAAALLATGRFEDPYGAMFAAWQAVPGFYDARNWYATKLGPLIYGASPEEGEAPEDAINTEAQNDRQGGI